MKHCQIMHYILEEKYSDIIILTRETMKENVSAIIRETSLASESKGLANYRMILVYHYNKRYIIWSEHQY